MAGKWNGIYTGLHRSCPSGFALELSQKLPSLNAKDLRQALDDGAVKFLSIDTNIFDQYHNGLEFGLLKRLSQFRNSEIKFVLSEIVYREVRAHMIKEALDSQAKLAAALKEVGGRWAVDTETRKAASDVLFRGQQASDAMQERLDAFKRVTEFEIVPAQGHIEIADLVDDYFNGGLPFENKVDKKHEFPDAIALRSLNEYARQRECLMLVVSNDGGWKEFCRASSNLACVSTLGEAMALLQKLPLVTATTLTERYEAGDLPELEKAISDRLAAYIDGMDLYVDASSSFAYDYEMPQSTFSAISYFDAPQFKVVQHNEDEELYVLETTVYAKVDVECDFTFTVRDPYDKDEFPIGGTSPILTTEMRFVLTVTIVGDPSAAFDINETEVIESDDWVDFGHVEPDFDHDDRDFEDAEPDVDEP